MSYLLQQAINIGATVQREKESVCMVLFWHIPGCCNYDAAQNIICFFRDMEAGRKFAKDNDRMPEMAVCSEFGEMRMQAPVLSEKLVEDFFERNRDTHSSIHYLDGPNNRIGEKFIRQCRVKFPADNAWYAEVERRVREVGTYARLREIVKLDFILE